jgi:predicted acyl esterase
MMNGDLFNQIRVIDFATAAATHRWRPDASGKFPVALVTTASNGRRVFRGPNGVVGTVGQSYLGLVQYFAAPERFSTTAAILRISCCP